MAIDIKKTDNWILIENKFLFNPTEVEQWIINLMPKIWEEMAYDRWNLLSIDFPGEYDIWWVSFGVIQSPEVLELDEVCDMSTWIFPDESVSKKLDQLEMEWNRINLNQLDEMNFAEATEGSEQEVEVKIE